MIGLLTAVLHQAPLAYAETEGPLSLCKFLQHSLTHNESVPGNAVADSERFSLTESVLKFLLFVVERMVDQREPFVQSGLMTFCLGT